MQEQGEVKTSGIVKDHGLTSRPPGDNVHYFALRTKGSRSLNEGDNIEFEVIKGPKGPQAQNVVLL